MKMKNKEQIEKLKDNAELAWASYGYFHLTNKNYKPEGFWNDGKGKLENFRKIKKDEVAIPTLADIIDIEYNNLFNVDFAPLQAKRFFEKYDLLIHQPNTSSGFSASFFQHKQTKEFTLNHKR